MYNYIHLPTTDNYIHGINNIMNEIVTYGYSAVPTQKST